MKGKKFLHEISHANEWEVFIIHVGYFKYKIGFWHFYFIVDETGYIFCIKIPLCSSKILCETFT